jgi:predicted DNA-binding transcriptional regulator AlpA
MDTPASVEVIRPRRHRPKPLPPNLPPNALCTATEAAALRRVSPATWWAHVRTGLAPAPIYLSPRCPRWRVSDVVPARTAAAE